MKERKTLGTRLSKNWVRDAYERKHKIDLDDIQDALEHYLEDHPEIDMIKIEAGRKDEKFEILGIHGPGIYVDTTVRPTCKNRLTKLVPNVVRPNVAKTNQIKF